MASVWILVKTFDFLFDGQGFLVYNMGINSMGRGVPVEEKDCMLPPLVLPLALSLLVICITAGYGIYRFLRERAYQRRWAEYNDCGLM